jgi:hypothetical protein
VGIFGPGYERIRAPVKTVMNRWFQCNYGNIRQAEQLLASQGSIGFMELFHVTKVEVTLRLTVSMPRCRAHSRPCDQILLPVGMLLSEICGLFSVGRPLWREDGSAIYSVITEWSESRRTRNRTLLSYLRLPQPGGPGTRIYIPQE